MKINFFQAQDIAAEELRRVIANSSRLFRYKFDELFLRREEPSFWTFGMASPQLMDEGFAPGAIFVSVDKLDGHVWNDEEVTRYYEQCAVAAKQLQAA